MSDQPVNYAGPCMMGLLYSQMERANWLPAPKGSLYMALREYSPDPAILTREWEPPGIQKIK